MHPGHRQGVAGAHHHPLIFGGQLIRPGDVVKGDCDGVVVVRREDLASAVEACRVREEAEDRYIARYHAGETPIDISDYWPLLRGKGLTIES